MTESSHPIGLIRHEDILQPFVLHKSSVRGRMVRLCTALDTILSRHEKPPSVDLLLGELLTLAAMLSANLPEGGILTLQAKGNGPVAFMVVDAVHGGGLRGYADMREGGKESILAREAEHERSLTLAELMGEGYLAMTLDPGYGDPYQGIVPLEGETITEAVTHYFTQSQQLDVMFHLRMERRRAEHGTLRWASGGIMLERMPEEGGHPVETLADINGWEYNALLVDTASTEELLDPHLAPSALLYRLFNEGGVWVSDPHPLFMNCRCSREKIAGILASMGEAAQEEMKVDGTITVTCQFCNRSEIFREED